MKPQLISSNPQWWENSSVIPSVWLLTHLLRPVSRKSDIKVFSGGSQEFAGMGCKSFH